MWIERFRRGLVAAVMSVASLLVAMVFAVLVLPFHSSKKAHGYFTGELKVGPADTWTQEWARERHQIRRIELGYGWYHAGTAVLGVIIWASMLVLFAPSAAVSVLKEGGTFGVVFWSAYWVMTGLYITLTSLGLFMIRHEKRDVRGLESDCCDL